MAHMIKGNGVMQRPITQQLQPQLHSTVPQQRQGVIVGAVVSKPGSDPARDGQQLRTSLIPGVAEIQSTPGILNVNLSQTKAADASNADMHNLANTKEKTPMCLVNELARFSKIQHQYTLTDEQGPAHKKNFYVKLKLGTEEYAASGASIKKAQHSAAAIALEETLYPKPPVRQPRLVTHPRMQYNMGMGLDHNDQSNKDSVTPTVELNSLVMKRNEIATYRAIESPRHSYYAHTGPTVTATGMAGAPPLSGSNEWHGYVPRSTFGRFPRIFYVSLAVGSREFFGEGPTRQAARHNAADKALKILQALPLPNEQTDNKMASSEQTDNTDFGPGGDGRAAAVGSLAGGVKSEISLVHEIALRRSLSVTFDVERESGPPHLKNFVTRCTCGNISVTGEGNSKKVSKKRAAEVMLEKLNALPPLPLSAIKIKRPVQTKKKNKNLIKMQKAAPDYGMQINPISRLIQIQQAKKEKEPFYTFIGDRGQPRKREFVIQVQVGDHTCQGIGPNKKLAKRSAAEAMLQELGYSKPSPQPIKPAIKTEGSPSGDKKVSFIDQDLNQTSRQLVPGVILMPDSNKMPNYCVQGAMIPGLPNMMGNHSAQTIATIAKELLETRTSGTAEAIRQRTAPGTMMRPLQRHEEMLFYMGEVLCFTVQFTDFPKQNNKNELLSLVTLSTVPPQVSHGAGVARDESHDMAAQQALRTLAVLDQPQMQPQMQQQMQQQHKPQPLMDVKLESVDHRGDGLHLKQEV